MPDDVTGPAQASIGQDYISWANIGSTARIALEKRREAGEVMTYHLDGWVVREYPGQVIVRLAPIDGFRYEDFPDAP